MKRPATVALAGALLICLLACGGGGTVDPVVRIPISVSVAPQSLQMDISTQTPSTTQFTATVTETSNTAVTWQVNGVAGGNGTFGTISSAGLYTAPTVLPSPATVTITAMALAEPGKSGSATVTLKAPVLVSVSPSAVAMETSPGVGSNTYQFTATVQNASDSGVIWQVNGVPGGTSSYGTISPAGVYSAPLLVPDQPVVVTAVAKADATKSASAKVALSWYFNINLSLPDGGTTTVTANTVQTIAANVDTYCNTRDVLWTVNGIPVGSAAVGMVYPRMNWLQTVYYNAPATVTAPTTVVVTATAKMNPTKSASMTLTIVPGDATQVLTLTPDASSVPVAGTQQFAALLNGNSVAASYWMAAGQYASMATGRITNAGLYTAPYEVPDTGVVVVTASYGDFPPKVATAMVTVTPPAVDPNTRVNGDYAFSLSDFNHTMQMVGSFTGDGNGHISGMADINTSQGLLRDYTFSGTYNLGADGRGVATIALPVAPSVAPQNETFCLMFVSDSYAYIYEKNGWLAGTIYKQDTASFNAAAINGPYVFRIDGLSFEIVPILGKTGSHIALAGVVNANGAGNVTGHGDVSLKGAIATSTVAGSYTVGAHGRGTVALTTSSGTSQFAAVVISPDKLLLASMDDVASQTSTAPILIGTAERQSGAPFAASSLNGPFVYYANGPQFTQLGRLVGDGAGHLSGGILDQRTLEAPGSTWMATTLDVPFTGSYTVDADGRAAATFSGTNAPKGAVWYMVSAEKFFLLLDGPTVAATGEGFAQSGLPFDVANLTGTYAVQLIIPPDMLTGWVLRDPNFWYPFSWVDYSWAGRVEADFNFDVFDQIGRGRIFLISGYSLPTLKYYAVSGSKLLLMSIDNIPGEGNQMGWMEKVQ